jgi:hypothetical protein
LKRKKSETEKGGGSLPFDAFKGSHSIGLLLEPRRVELSFGDEKELLLAVATYAYEGEVGFSAETIYPPFARMLHSLPKGISIEFVPSTIQLKKQTMMRVKILVKANSSIKPGNYTICIRTEPFCPPFGDKSFVMDIINKKDEKDENHISI